MPKRPFGVTLLLWMVLILTAWGVVRFFAALRWQSVLIEFGSSLSPLYLSITGAGWGAAGSVLLISILMRKYWARFGIATFILLWLIEYWLERVFGQAGRANLYFALACTIGIILIGSIIVRFETTKSYFSRSEDHEQPDETPNPE